MRFIKLILSIILSVCVLWGILIVSGPTLIKLLTNYYFKNSLKVYEVAISPKLEVEMARVEFFDTSDQDPRNPVITFNSLEMKLSDLFHGLSLDIQIGQGKFSNQFSFKSASILVENLLAFSIRNKPIVGSIKDINLANNIHFKGVDAKGSLNIASLELKDLSFSVNYFRHLSNTSLRVENNRGFINSFNFLRPLDDQSNNVEIKSVFVNQSDTFQFDQELIISIKNNKGLVEIKSHLNNIQDKSGKFALDDFIVNIVWRLGVGFTNINPTFQVSGLAIPKWDLIIPDVKGKMSRSEQQKLVELEGNLGNLRLPPYDKYIGNIKDGTFKVSLDLTSKKPEQIVLANGFLALASKPPVIFEFNSSSNLEVTESLEDCYLKDCLFRQSIVEYMLQVDVEKLYGFLECTKAPCSLDSFSHEILTENTAQFFLYLSETGILNPLILAAAYSQLASSVPIGLGHKLILQ